MNDVKGLPMIKFVQNPNIPEGFAALVIVDGRTPNEIIEALGRSNVTILKTGVHPWLSKPVSGHPDMLLHHLGGADIVYAPGLDEELLGGLLEEGFRLIKGKTSITEEYPGDIAYNVARIGKFFFHNLKFTDPVLRYELERRGAVPVHVSQGYAKCSVSVVDETSIITEDKGIAEAAKGKGIDVLLLEADKNISLPELSYGFIGGSSGLLGKSVWAVAGDAGKLTQHEEIARFLQKRGMSVVSLGCDYPLDIGSIIALKEFA